MMEKQLTERQHLKEVIEQLLDTNQHNYSFLKADFTTLLEDSAKDFISFLINGYEHKETYDLLIDGGLNKEFSIWIWKLSLKYGRGIWNEIKDGSYKYDWKSLTTRIIIADEKLIELDFTRYDSHEFKLEMSLNSTLQLIDRVSLSILNSFKNLDEQDKEILNSAIDNLNEFLNGSTS
ncbi:hypothetical protein [Paenibacillus sp. MMS20-IR301]|uniref:hypothetical protein n=1 Tax=Paenibacillus sp. MMS20-IR301 TaxID=2895946 RepID=UPI0028E564C7|nr:hypothetical protein [Paenibacillus sp. MMS20-IR301]WNS43865.1 hypothetical protein LOS79_00955 [Paenibacillus sp. MMS20-IR301]